MAEVDDDSVGGIGGHATHVREQLVWSRGQHGHGCQRRAIGQPLAAGNGGDRKLRQRRGWPDIAKQRAVAGHDDPTAARRDHRHRDLLDDLDL